MRVLFLLAVLFTLCSGSENFNTLDNYHADRIPVVKLPVVHDHYVNVVIGNPGKDMRLRIVWGLNISLVLFTSPDEVSLTYTEHPSTVLVYMGASLIRLGFEVDYHLWDKRVAVAHDGLLGMGYWSDIWRYWSKVTYSSQKLVLGAFDKNVARTNYKPFTMILTEEHPWVDVKVHGWNYTLTYDQTSKYSYFPHSLYRNITNYDIEINHLHMEIDDGDVKEPLVSGFDRMLVKHKNSVNDTLIVLGEQFAHSFVLYYDAITHTRIVMASYDLFADARAQPEYTYFCMILYFTLSVFWLAVVWTHERHGLPRFGLQSFTSHHHPRAPLFSMIELFVYVSALLILLTESVGFARYRTMAFYMDASDNIAYYIVFSVFMYSSILAGISLGLYSYKTLHLIGFRRIFVETTTFGLFWLSLLHQHSLFAVYTLVFSAAFYAVLRTLQFVMAVLLERDALAFLSFFYTGVSVGFLVIYNILPILNYYYNGFNDLFYSAMMLVFFVYFMPILGTLVNYPMAIIQNSVVDIKEELEEEVKARSDLPEEEEEAEKNYLLSWLL
jgi:hypothetical protein